MSIATATTSDVTLNTQALDSLAVSIATDPMALELAVQDTSLIMDYTMAGAELQASPQKAEEAGQHTALAAAPPASTAGAVTVNAAGVSDVTLSPNERLSPVTSSADLAYSLGGTAYRSLPSSPQHEALNYSGYTTSLAAMPTAHLTSATPSSPLESPQSLSPPQSLSQSLSPPQSLSQSLSPPQSLSYSLSPPQSALESMQPLSLYQAVNPQSIQSLTSFQQQQQQQMEGGSTSPSAKGAKGR